jgi:hypothetical protein
MLPQRQVRFAPGVDQTRRLAVDRDLVGGEFVRERPREPNKAGLGRHDVGALLGAGVTADAADVDDGVAAARLQRRQRAFDRQEGATRMTPSTLCRWLRLI